MESLYAMNNSKAFKRYCGKEFYPHIIRSHHATRRVKEFLKRKKDYQQGRDENAVFFLAADLGHKRFEKKGGLGKIIIP